MKTTFIYGLIDPRTCTLRYVGKADNPTQRLAAHLTPSALQETTRRARWLSTLVHAGMRPTMVVLEEVSRESWIAAEQEWIRVARDLGCDLVNATQGGEGTVGYTPSAETRSRLSRAQRRIWSDAGHKLARSDSQRRAWGEMPLEARVDRLRPFLQASGSAEVRVVVARSNQGKTRIKNKASRYVGVSWRSRESRWYAKIGVAGRQRYLGTFSDEVEAAKAYDLAALEIYGPNARLNFPDEVSRGS